MSNQNNFPELTPLEDYLLVVDDKEYLDEFYEMKRIISRTRDLMFKQGGIAPASIIMRMIEAYDEKYIKPHEIGE